ncbi:MAG: hypothetical protein AB1424_11965 [Thermodesulfobacteriota bacterium]
MNGIEVRETGPGFLSLAVAGLQDNQEMAQAIRERFSPIQGIRRLEIDHTVGLMTVSFNYREVTSIFSLLALKQAFNAIFPEVNVLELASLLQDNLKE